MATEEQATMEGVQTIDAFGYSGCLAIENGQTRVVLGPHAGGRVLEYAVAGQNALYLDPTHAGWTYTPGAATLNPSGGRCDIGPEHTIPRHPSLWLGPWSAESVGPRHVRMTSEDDPATGVRLVRDFSLDPASTRLSFTQTMINHSTETTGWCHWGRTFAGHGGVAVVPLTPASRFPKGYVRYGPGSAIDFRPDDASIVQRGDYLVILGIPEYPKLGFDSLAGWFAYVLPRGPLFLKRYPVFRDRVYNEVAGLTACIYYPRERFCELEPIGPRETLAPGASAAFTEEWWLLPCPPTGGDLDPDEIVRRVEEAVPAALRRPVA
jgi:hypothetical protein